jgi:O-antigen ligase
MIGLLVAVTVYLTFIEMRRKWLVVAVGIVGFILAAIIFDLPIGRLLNKSAGGRGTIEFRILQWQTGWTMFQRHPILGVGPGNFMTEYHRYHYDFPSHDKVLVVGPLHNAILNQMAEAGLVGLFLLLLLLASVILTLLNVRMKSPDPYLRQVSVIMMAAFAGWSAALCFYPSFLDEQGWILMGITMGVWNIHQKILKETSSVEETARLKMLS